MDKQVILIGKRNTGIPLLLNSIRNKKIDECLRCIRKSEYYIICCNPDPVFGMKPKLSLFTLTDDK